MIWEYKDFYVDYLSDDLNKADWRVSVGGEVVTGISNILNHFGEKGWEAVSISPMISEPMDVTPNTRECTVLLVVLKRQK